MRKLLLTLVGLLTCMSLMAADVNFNFKSNSYGITTTPASQGTGVATTGGVTVKAAKCGYKESESLRVYEAVDDSPELTISAPSGSKVTKITFTLSQGSFRLESGQSGSFNSNMWQYGTGLESVKFTCSAQTRVTQIGVTLSDNGGSTTTYVAKPKISPDGGEIDEYTTISLSSATYGVQMHYSWDGGVTYQDGFNPAPQAGTLQAYATKDGVSSEMAYAVFTMASTGGDDPDPVTPITGKGWQLVTSVSQLAVGDKVIIANQDATTAMSTEKKDNNRPSTEVTFNDDKSVILNPSVSVLQLKIGGAMDAWTFETLNYLGEDGNGYLGSVDNSSKSSKNYCQVKATVTSGCKAKITIDATTKAATVQFNSTGTTVSNYLRYNNGLFACYKTATSQDPVFIYKWVEDETPTEEKPAVPVVTTDNNVTISDGDEVTLPYGTKITVYSAGADFLVDAEGNMLEGNTHTFTLTENVICEYYGMNDKGDSDHVYFMIDVAKADLTVKFGSTEVAAGESYTVAEGTELTLTTTTGTTLTVFDENLEAVATIEAKSLKYTVMEDCILTFEATTPAAGTSTMIEEVLFVIDQNAYADAFTLVTSTDEITDRDEYVLMYTDKNGNNYAMANTYTTTQNRYLSADTDVTVSGTQLNATENTMIFTFVTIDGKRYLMVDNYGNDGFKYMSGRTGGNNYTDLKDAISDLGVVTATITDDGYADICFINALNGESPRYLRFNNSASPKCFSLYKASDAVKLYKREFAMPAPMEAHTDTHFVITSNGGTLYVKEFEGLKPGVEITPKAVHTALDGFVPQTGDWTKEIASVDSYQTVEAYVEHKGRVSDILSINLHPGGGTSTGIENVGADVEGAVEYFNMQGMRISEPAKGQVVIRRQGAKVEKIAVR